MATAEVRVRNWLVVCLGLAGAGCAPAAAPAPPQPLAGALDVAVGADTVWLTLHATNVSGGPLLLRFGSAQQFDFEVRPSGGGEVWRWSAERVFAQVVTEERLESGGTRHWRVSWPAAGRRGSYVAVGRLLAADRPLVLEAAFEVGRE